MKYVHYLALYLSLLLLVACGGSEVTEDGDTTSSPDSAQDHTISVTKAQFEASNMALGTLQTHSFADRIKANGYLDVPPQNRAKVSAYMEGYIHQVNLLIGDQVKKGQLLVRLITLPICSFSKTTWTRKNSWLF
ncbi:MAG: hypothetical protein WA960_06190 [Tunicatimonas sp.]